MRLASNRIKKKYFRQKSKGILKKSNKKAAVCLRKAGYLDTDDLETVDYNNNNIIILIILQQSIIIEKILMKLTKRTRQGNK